MRETVIKLPGYQILTPLHESGDSLVYRAVKESDRTPVVLKVLKDEYPSPDKLNEYSWEFEINQLLKDRPGIVCCYGMERAHNSLFIVQEDFGAESLASLVRGRKLTLEEILTIASQIADALGVVHRSDVIHCNLSPGNILVNPQTLQVKITDFGQASFPSKPRIHLSALELPAESLPYISPEQTGRMNRKIDHRSDFYSLGVTLFELLTGRRPFESGEPLELIHAHIAKPPPTPVLINKAIPRVLSDMVLRLLAKNPQERYSSALGIKADLEICLRHLQQTGDIPGFPLGDQDVSERLQIPTSLYGRERETKLLTEGFERAVDGKKSLLVVAGPSGIGKSTYVQQLRTSLAERGGFFILGKFELLQRDTPYEAFVNAFQQLTEQLLTESEDNLSRWRERILTALEPNAQVLVEVIPDLKLILGEQEAAASLPPAETQNRFNLVVQRFVKLFAQKNHPLVLVLDDLQWADSASLNLLELLMTSADIQSLYLVATYRDNEVSEVHPLMTLLERLRERTGGVEQITLPNLQATHVTELVADTFRTPLDSARALAELIHSKTDGNPFFVNEFLQMLAAKGMVAFAPESASWTWDLEQIKTQNITDNVAKLMGQKLQLLPLDVRELLTIGSCVGNQFSCGLLRDISGRPEPTILEGLGRACELGLLVLVAPPKHEPSPEGGGGFYQFSHNRVHQAVYARIPRARRLELHREIGKALFARTPQDQLDTRIFDIVAQFNLISELIEAPGEKEALIQLNFKAGRKAKASAAVEPALRYFNIARDLLGDGGWETHYPLMLELTEEAAEAASLLGDHVLTEKLTQLILDRAHTPVERSRAYQIRISAHNARKEPREAIRDAIAGLAELGLSLPEHPSRAHLLTEYGRTRLALLGKRIEQLEDLPTMNDPSLLAAVRIMRAVAVLAYISNPLLSAIITLRQVRMVLKHGHNAWSASIFASFSIILCGPVGDLQTGYRVGKLALKLVDKHQVLSLKCRVLGLVGTFGIHAREHLSASFPLFQSGIQLGQQAGDFEYTALCAHVYCQYSFYQGKELTALVADLTSMGQLITQLRQEIYLTYNKIFLQTAQNLQGNSADPCQLKGAIIDQDSFLDDLQEKHDRTGSLAYFYTTALLSYLFHDFERALSHAQRGEELLDAAPGMFGVSRMRALVSLCALAVYPDRPAREQKALLAKVKKNLQRLAALSRHAPMNHAHLVLLVEAERARVLGEDSLAVERYDRAIQMAKENQFTNDLALANELAGLYYVALNKSQLGRSYLQDARYAYQRWGATAKLSQMEAQYRIMLMKSDPLAHGHFPMSSQISSTQTIKTHSQTVDTGILDLASVIKAYQGLSQEIVLSSLLHKLMVILIENAGAERGFLILNRDGALWIEADIDLIRAQPIRVESTLLGETIDLSTAIVNLVSRTKKTLVLGDAAQQGEFTHDPYIALRHPRSVLAMPIMHHGTLTGVLYLENNQTTDAFTPERVEVLGLLASQAAISIENAQLYRMLQHALERAQESIRVKNAFLARTSHELRTPLNAIINLPQLILDKYRTYPVAQCSGCGMLFHLESAEEGIPERCPNCEAAGCLEQDVFPQYSGDPEEVLRVQHIIQDSGRVLLQIVNNILDISDLENKQAKLHLAQVQVTELLARVQELIRPLSVKSAIGVSVQEVPTGLTIEVDYLKFGQVLYNLLDNAIKFSAEGSEVALEVQPQTEETWFLVRDRGIGIDPKDHQLIFESFRQVEEGANRKYGGAGLGLAITKNLVELHGGRIWLESEIGQGSTFFVAVPHRPKPGGPRPESP